MDRDTLNIIRSNPYIYSFLREDSTHYKYLYEDKNYIRVLKELAEEKYKVRFVDKLEKLKDNLVLINTFFDVMK